MVNITNLRGDKIDLDPTKCAEVDVAAGTAILRMEDGTDQIVRLRDYNRFLVRDFGAPHLVRSSKREGYTWAEKK